MEAADPRLERRLEELASEICGADPGDGDPLLLLDSLGQAELAMAVEEELGVRLADGSLRSLRHAVAGVGDGWAPAGSLLRGVGPLQPPARAAVRPLLRRYFRLRVEARDRVPAAGPVVLAANHESMWDIPVLAVASPRPMVFMAKEEIFSNPLMARFFTALGGFPATRAGSDLTAVRTALEVLRTGRVLGMFPEGTRYREGILPFKRGTAWAALVEGAPLVPVAMTGLGKVVSAGAWLPRPVKVSVTFGEPIPVEREPDRRLRMKKSATLTAHLQSEVERLLDEASSRS